uniref:Cysteine rich secreted protein n=1 Tax=Riptortus pedestris TaxID=329032 RepID=R4WCR0_RIPPE|nr:cysteine rich secreted protein [Riptortus pedestris]
MGKILCGIVIVFLICQVFVELEDKERKTQCGGTKYCREGFSCCGAKYCCPNHRWCCWERFDPPNCCRWPWELKLGKQAGWSAKTPRQS